MTPCVACGALGWIWLGGLLWWTRFEKLGELVYNNIRSFCKKKEPTADVFETLTPAVLNKHLSSIMPGLTAKVGGWVLTFDL